MKNNFLLSIIVTVYKSEKYIENTVMSILNQTSNEFEIVFVNNGSIDNSFPIIYNLLNNRTNIKYQIIEVGGGENQGISAGRNAGLRIARGNYICYVDSDDMIAPNYCEEIHKKFNESQADIILYGYQQVDMLNNYGKKIKVTNNKDWARWGLDMLWCYTVRKELLIKNKIEFIVGIENEDRCFSIRVANVAKSIAIIGKNLYYYRVNVNSATNHYHEYLERSPESREYIFKLFRKIYSQNNRKQDKKLILYNITKFYYAILEGLFVKNERKILLKEYKLHQKYFMKYFPNYKNQKISLFKPSGERVIIKWAIFCSIILERINLFNEFLLFLNNISKINKK